MSWPIEHFHYMPAPSSFVEMMPGAVKSLNQCAGPLPAKSVIARHGAVQGLLGRAQNLGPGGWVCEVRGSNGVSAS